MASPKRTSGKIYDRGTRVDYDGKSIRGLGGARIYSRTATFFDHHIGITVANMGWATHTTESGGANDAAVLALVTPAEGTTRGFAQMKSGDTAADGVTATCPLALVPANDATYRPLVMEVRGNAAVYADVLDMVIGFMDTVSNAANDVSYRLSASSTLTTSAPNDASVFDISPTPTSGVINAAASTTYVALITSTSGTDTIQAAGTQTGTSAAYATKTTTPVFDVTANHIYRVELDVNGSSYFFIDDAFVGQFYQAQDATDLAVAQVNVTSTANNGTWNQDYFLAAGGA